MCSLIRAHYEDGGVLLQPELHHGIVPGKLLVCTHLKLVHGLAQLRHSRQPRVNYVTTTNESQVLHSIILFENFILHTTLDVCVVSNWFAMIKVQLQHDYMTCICVAICTKEIR